ncbi:N-chimaerin-like protein [Leptotrombidium deliense]|uniref:Beta-chimaerin n=1 Tax=Leptotrombidium deliense TaxID=299467 RepID=A0A443SP87_9ACAR|nr:N-chimaerin-like protein [Leptotrombidium deliense]
MAKNGLLFDESNQNMLNLWKHYLYELQLRAPTPKRVVCNKQILEKPSHYGREYHGIMSRDESNKLLINEDGRYLVRESSRTPGQFTLSLRFNGVVKNFRLYYDGKHYVGEKRFDTIHDLVADGLITLYIEANAADYISALGSGCKYEESPYMTLHKRHKKGRAKRKEERRSQMQVTRIDNYQDEVDQDFDEKVDVQLFEKSHSFKVHNFMGLPFCDFCGNFMWGLLGQGVKCEDCGFNAHRKCSEKVPNDCCPDLRHIRRVFGVDLTTFVKAYNTVRPFVVDFCVKEIENRGLHIEGLYRVSGFADDVENLKLKLEADLEESESCLKSYDDVHVITGVLKLYFRLLPIPLITFDGYPYFLAAVKKSTFDDQISELKEAISKLPPAHYQTLKYLIAHLHRVSQQSDSNLMTPYNLSTIFCPTLMRTPNIGLMPFQVNSWQLECMVLEMLITHHSKLFK